MKKRNAGTRLTASIFLLVFLSICLCLTSSALVLATVDMRGNVFTTGRVEIDLNGGAPIVTQEELMFAPGMTLKKDFTLENKSTCEVYYRLYFTNISGALAEHLQVRLLCEDRELLTGTPATLTRDHVGAADDVLAAGQRKTFTLVFVFPEESNNSAQAQYLGFDLAADAVQVKNNPEKAFD